MRQGIVGVDLVKEVTCSETYEYDVEWAWGNGSGEEKLRTWTSELELTLRVVVMDFGVKLNILRMLKMVGCDVTVVPALGKG